MFLARAIEHKDGVERTAIEVPLFVRAHLGVQLQAYFSLPPREDMPEGLSQLVRRIENALAAGEGVTAAEFRDDLMDAIPALRTFAFSLSGDANRSDDLVQETLVKAWANQHRFQPGSNMIAWLFTILRNQFYSEIRKRKRAIEDADGAIASRMTVPAAQEHSADLRTMQVHLAKLPTGQREAIMLVAAQGMTYEAAAEVLGCQVGTVKSRVSRARAVLLEQLGMQDERLPA
ncbi:sigma-70 family RNA polymerase sigma factor [Methylobacterium brachiatum]|uniref:sigma-70 family RNA polymerase sigma factor n=1 Tax=Methylobacterium brachiatum TaxID=269660 RepID=UPI000EFD425F|nr:sigma-70 family RNA polymerase sigma factor [Methylobacterium brachiatum]AYO86678.1 sigma-70 family RNA polymerase sigma factor [Methylobacterium brachiatum]